MLKGRSGSLSSKFLSIVALLITHEHCQSRGSATHYPHKQLGWVTIPLDQRHALHLRLIFSVDQFLIFLFTKLVFVLQNRRCVTLCIKYLTVRAVSGKVLRTFSVRPLCPLASKMCTLSKPEPTVFNCSDKLALYPAHS